MNKQINTFPEDLSQKHLLVLLVTLLIIPLLWGTGLFKIPVGSYFPNLNRPFFWTFILSIFVLHWTSFFLIIGVTRPSSAQLLNFSIPFYKKYRIFLLLVLVVLGVLAFMAPNYLYPDGIPGESLTLGEIGPVSSWERLAFVFISITAGVCEEVIFRAYGISVLEKFLKNKVAALIISSLAFMSLHGIAFLPWYLMVQYFIIGLIFGFFFQKYRRLEILILVHILIDILVAVSVP